MSSVHVGHEDFDCVMSNTGGFANESVRQRMKSIRQRLYASHVSIRLARQWMKERGISCMARG